MNYFSQWPEIEFIRQDESRVKASDALKDKEYVIFFAGAPWHAGYREFIPTMKTFYETYHEKKNFEVILLTRGDTEEEILIDFFNPEYGKTFLLPCNAKMRAARMAKKAKALEGNSNGGGPGMSSSSSASSTEKNHKADHHKKEEENDIKKEVEDKEEKQKEEEKKVIAALATGEAEAEGALVPVPRVGKHGNYLLLDPAHSHVVGTPILFFFRVLSYPGVIVCRTGAPVVNPSPKNVYPLPPPRAKPYLPAVVRPPPMERDEEGKLKFTPSIPDTRCYPDLCTIAGKWMITKKDPQAEQFPWDAMSFTKGPIYFLFFLLFMVIAGAVVAVILAKNPDLRLRVNTFIGYPLLDVPLPG